MSIENCQFKVYSCTPFPAALPLFSINIEETFISWYMPACFQYLNPNCLLCANYSFPLVISIIIITEKPTCSSAINKFHSVHMALSSWYCAGCSFQKIILWCAIWLGMNFRNIIAIIHSLKTSSYCLVPTITDYWGITTNKIPHVYSVIASGVMFNNAIHCKHSKMTRFLNIGTKVRSV